MEVFTINMATTSQIEAGRNGWQTNPDESSQVSEILALFTEHQLTPNEDLKFLTRIGLCTEERSPKWQRRTYKSLQLALAMNKNADYRIDNNQLAAAIVTHDFAMGFLPESLLNKTKRLNVKETKLMRTHINSAADLIHRMQDFAEAKEMILAHHEYVDGSGYPNQLVDDEICDGAKVLAITDAFTAQGKAKVMHGVMEISRYSGSQFSPFWLNHFNQVVRSVANK